MLLVVAHGETAGAEVEELDQAVAGRHGHLVFVGLAPGHVEKAVLCVERRLLVDLARVVDR